MSTRFLLVDHIQHLVPGKIIQGIKYISPAEFYLTKDAQGPCFIPSLVGEALGQLAAWNIMFCNGFSARPVAGIVSAAQLIRPVRVGETLLLESHIDSQDESAVQYHSIARVHDEVVFRVESALGPLLPMSDFIEAEQVRQQFAEINTLEPPPSSSMPSATLDPNALQFDRITQNEPGKQLRAEKYIQESAPYFPDHFPRKPVLPLTILLQCKLHLAQEFLRLAKLGKPYQITHMRKIKMSEFVQPGNILMCHLQIKHLDEKELILSFRSEVNNKRVCVLEMVFRALEPNIGGSTV